MVSSAGLSALNFTKLQYFSTNYHKCLSKLLLLHLNAFVTGLRSLLGLAVGHQPIGFILPEFVSYLGERGMVCVGNGWHFCTPVLMNMWNITFQVAGSESCVFKKCQEQIIFTVIFVIRAWRVLGRITIITFCFSADNSTILGQSPNAVSISGQRWRRWANIETVLVNGNGKNSRITTSTYNQLFLMSRGNDGN